MSGEQQNPSEVDALPPPTPEAVSLRVFTCAFLSTMNRRKGEAFLREVARLYADEDEMAKIWPIRPTSERPAVLRARAASLAWFRATLPTFLASLRKE